MNIRTATCAFGAAALLLACDSALAQDVWHSEATINGVQYTMTAKNLVSAAGDINSSHYSTPISPAYNGVGSIRIQRQLDARVCTGSLLADGKTVLTAAHCVRSIAGNEVVSVSVNFYPASAAPVTMNAASYTIAPGYTGAVIDQNDIAVVRLTAEADAGITRYGLATASGENSAFKFVGFGVAGSYGTGVSGGTDFGLSYRHTGENLFDINMGDSKWNNYWTATEGLKSTNVLLADFDNGTTGKNSNDAMCWVGLTNHTTTMGASECDAGRGMFEAMVSGGDSGGPAFVNGKIAAVTSFGLTYGQAATPYPDVDDVLNSSFGEFGGFADVTYNSAFIYSQLDLTSLDVTGDGPELSTTPEPSSMLLLGSGFALILGVMRKRRLAA